MTQTILWAISVIVGAMAAGIGYLSTRPAGAGLRSRPGCGSVLRSRLRSAVVVTLKTGETYRGVLFEVDRHALVLRNAEALAAGGKQITVDGELLVLRGDVAYLQRP